MRLQVTPSRRRDFKIRDFKQIATAGANTAAGSKFPPKMRHCACTSVASSRSVKSEGVTKTQTPKTQTSDPEKSDPENSDPLKSKLFSILFT